LSAPFFATVFIVIQWFTADRWIPLPGSKRNYRNLSVALSGPSHFLPNLLTIEIQQIKVHAGSGESPTTERQAQAGFVDEADSLDLPSCIYLITIAFHPVSLQITLQETKLR
jgi:hypothetical protein